MKGINDRQRLMLADNGIDDDGFATNDGTLCRCWVLLTTILVPAMLMWTTIEARLWFVTMVGLKKSESNAIDQACTVVFPTG